LPVTPSVVSLVFAIPELIAETFRLSTAVMANSPAVNALRSVLIAQFKGTIVQRSLGACQPHSTRNTVLMNAIHPNLGPKACVLVAKKVTKAPVQKPPRGIDNLLGERAGHLFNLL